MSNQPPLNPDALEAAADAVSELYTDGHCPKAEDAAEVAVSAYLAAALPEVTSVEEFLALHPGTYLLCADEVVRAKFLTVPREWMLPARVLYRPEVKP